VEFPVYGLMSAGLQGEVFMMIDLGGYYHLKHLQAKSFCFVTATPLSVKRKTMLTSACHYACYKVR